MPPNNSTMTTPDFAHSTLGFSNWVGGDPLLSTFIRWPEAELVPDWMSEPGSE